MFTSKRTDSSRLQDQPEPVFNHVARGVDFFERIGAYAKERAQIEEEYAAKLRYPLTTRRGASGPRGQTSSVIRLLNKAPFTDSLSSAPHGHSTPGGRRLLNANHAHKNRNDPQKRHADKALKAVNE